VSVTINLYGFDGATFGPEEATVLAQKLVDAAARISQRIAAKHR